MATTRAAFRASIEGDTVIIVDLDGDVSVTNDAEAVVTAVAGLIKVRRILYKDTSGDWSEIIFSRDKNLTPTFKGFRDVDQKDVVKFNLNHR